MKITYIEKNRQMALIFLMAEDCHTWLKFHRLMFLGNEK